VGDVTDAVMAENGTAPAVDGQVHDLARWTPSSTLTARAAVPAWPRLPRTRVHHERPVNDKIARLRLDC
jgi:hypothetical protein